MKYKYTLTAVAAIFAFTPLTALSGGNPEHVKFPKGYEKTFTKYATVNRANQTQVAKLFANKPAVSGYTQGKEGASGSVVVMEIYSIKTDDDGKPIPGNDGIFEIDSLAAIGVMEKQDKWSADFPAEGRAGNWGFALYGPDGTVKNNDLNCAQCHAPLGEQDYLFTHQKLVDFVKN